MEVPVLSAVGVRLPNALRACCVGPYSYVPTSFRVLHKLNYSKLG